MAWTFYWAWVDASETTFDAETHAVNDQEVMAFRLTHEEGAMPVLRVTLKNPYEGPFAVGKPRYAWFSFSDGVTTTWLFFGRVIGAPSNIAGEAVEYELLAKRQDWKALKTALAESLKVSPYYNPLFLSEDARGDLDAVLEGYSLDWHIDRAGNWSTSDVLTGEDGTVALTNATYESINVTNGQPPLNKFTMSTNCSWAQSAAFYVSIPIVSAIVETCTWSSLISDWPKSGTSLGGGWMVDQAFAVSLSRFDTLDPRTIEFSWTNNEKKHEQGDIVSYSYSATMPGFVTNPALFGYLIKEDVKPAVMPTDYEGSNLGVNVTLGSNVDPTYTYSATYAFCPPAKVQVYLSIRPDPTSSDFAEYLSVSMTADLQPVYRDEDEDSESETEEISCADPTQPVVSTVDQTTLFDEAVTYGVIIKPESYQVCVTPGTCGASPPVWNNTKGGTTTWGTAVFACMGATIDPIGDWVAGTAYAAGAFVYPPQVGYVYYSALVALGPTYVSVGTIIRADNGLSYQQCSTAGTTGTGDPAFSQTVGATTTDGSVVWTCIGANAPTGAEQLCISAGVSGATRPAFSSVAGTLTSDGSVTWASVAGYPAMKAPVTVMGSNFFATDAGKDAVEHLLARCRARLRMRSRAVEAKATIPFVDGINLSCRKNATITDARIPGGSLTGKITSYELYGDGQSGEFACDVTLGVAVGNGGSVTGATGTGAIFVDGVFETDFQQYTGSVELPMSDVSYSPLNMTQQAAGIPFSYAGAVAWATWGGPTLAQQRQIIAQQHGAMFIRKAMGGNSSQVESVLDQMFSDRTKLNNTMQNYGIWFELALNPISDKSLTSAYSVDANLSIPMGIDLTATGA